MRRWKKALIVMVVLALGAGVYADEAAPAITAADAMFTANNIWMMVSIFLVFTMHLGFATVETGLTRAKNTVNILFKNTAIVAIGLLTYALVGFNLMYPDTFIISGIFGFDGFGVVAPEGAAGLIDYAGGAYSYWTDFLFQGMFAATAATIVSGAVAERIKLPSFLIFSAIYVAVVYPFVGSWVWGGGWLAEMNFHDFAGSTLVHSVGGWGALASIILLGPRLGKYVNGKTRAIMGHNMPLVAIGVFLLWLGWFGFNGGSVLSGDPGAVSYVLVTTSMAAAAGIIGSMIATWSIQKKPDLTMVLNGCLAGLVGITAGADALTVMQAIWVGFFCGSIAVVSVLMFDKLKIDDPVGATTVHLVCGILGTLFVALSPDYTLGVQALGVLVYGAFCFPAAFIIMFVLKKTIGIRVSEEEELKGLDIGEHGMEAYSGFQFFTNS